MRKSTSILVSTASLTLRSMEPRLLHALAIDLHTPLYKQQIMHVHVNILQISLLLYMYMQVQSLAQKFETIYQSTVKTGLLV